jgi:hypothetical protein
MTWQIILLLAKNICPCQVRNPMMMVAAAGVPVAVAVVAGPIRTAQFLKNAVKKRRRSLEKGSARCSSSSSSRCLHINIRVVFTSSNSTRKKKPNAR